MNATNPTLIVTLLYNPQEVPQLYEKLLKHLVRPFDTGGLALAEYVAQGHEPFWINQESSVFVIPFALHVLKHLELADVALVQVGINVHGEVVVGWVEAEERFMQAMAGLPSEVESACIGYTLVYRAVVPADAKVDQLAQALLDELRVKEKYEHFPYKALAESPLQGGKLWLLKTGYSGQQSIYMALCSQEEQEDFDSGILLGHHAGLIYPDAIAHKAYFMARDYVQKKKREEFGEASEALLKQTITILASQLPTELAQSTPQPLAPTSQANLSEGQLEELDQLSDKAARLTVISSGLRKLQSDLKIHRFNYQSGLKKKHSFDQIGRYHRQRQNDILFRLNEDLTNANATLDAANTAILSLRAKYERQLVRSAEQQAQRDKEQHQIQSRAAERIEDILAIMTVALTVAQVVGKLAIGWQLVFVISSGLISWLIIQRFRNRYTDGT
jgi:hypothetical protein